MDLRPELLPAPVPESRLRELSPEIERIEHLPHNVVHPAASDLIFHPPAGLEDASAEEIIDAALTWRPVGS